MSSWSQGSPRGEGRCLILGPMAAGEPIAFIIGVRTLGAQMQPELPSCRAAGWERVSALPLHVPKVLLLPGLVSGDLRDAPDQGAKGDLHRSPIPVQQENSPSGGLWWWQWCQCPQDLEESISLSPFPQQCRP